jgi:uncharacterized protein (DUF302 family)
MYYIVETSKSFDHAAQDLEQAVVRHGFGVLHVHNIGDTLRSKGVDFDNQCKVFEVCNPVQAARVMSSNMELNMALPCRISVYTEAGKTRIGMIRPADMLAMLSTDPALADIAGEVEEKTKQMIDDAS